MGKIILFIVGCVVLCASPPLQGQTRELKSEGHVLGETAEQFFSEGWVGDLLRACQDRNWKSVRQLSKNAEAASSTSAKDLCANGKLAKQQATSGARLEFSGRGDAETMRADSFTLDGGHLIRISMVYAAPIANMQGYNPKSYSELFAGLRDAYGAPSKSYSEPVTNVYGVKYDARRCMWMGAEDVISIIEHPGSDAQTEIVAETLAEHNRVPKAANPLQ